MLLQTSDKCIRDFLLQVDAIYTQRGPDLGAFLRGSIPVKDQNAGLVEASRRKFDNLKSRVVIAPDQVRQVVHGLAKLTEALQSRGADLQHLSVPERGVFVLSFESESAENPTMADLIKDAAQAGFLRILREQGHRSIKFRVHSSLAPAYGFSYRGAYYGVTLTEDDLKALIATAEESELNNWVAALEKRFSLHSTDRRPHKAKDMPLFDKPDST